MLQNLAPVAANYRKAGIRFFVLAYFARSTGEIQGVREAASSIAAAEGADVEDAAISNDRPIGVVARDVMTILEWL
jgi:hypothetical protein